MQRFFPEAGRTRIRDAAGVRIYHVAGDVVSGLAGRERELDALWRVRCASPVGAFDVDRSGRVVVAQAGERLYRIEAPEED